MKADLLHLLSALSKTPAIGAEVWRALGESRLLAFIDNVPAMAPTNPLAQRQVVGLNVSCLSIAL